MRSRSRRRGFRAAGPSIAAFARGIRRLYIEEPNQSWRFSMYKAGRTIVAIAFTCMAMVPPALAQPAARAKAVSSSTDGVIATLFAAKTFDQTAISPDAQQVAWVEVTKEGSAIFLSAATDAAPRRITARGQSDI